MTRNEYVSTFVQQMYSIDNIELRAIRDVGRKQKGDYSAQDHLVLAENLPDIHSYDGFVDVDAFKIALIGYSFVKDNGDLELGEAFGRLKAIGFASQERVWKRLERLLECPRNSNVFIDLLVSELSYLRSEGITINWESFLKDLFSWGDSWVKGKHVKYFCNIK